MARKIRGLYQPSYTKTLPDGTRETRRVEGWWLKYSVRGKRVRVNLADHAAGQPVKDRRVAERIAARILSASEEKRANLVDPFEEQGRRPVEEHLTAFETALEASGATDKHVDDRLDCLRAFVKAKGVETIAMLDGSEANEWLVELRRRGLGARSVNRRRAALCQFGRWIVRERRKAFDPFVGLRKLNEDADRRHVRRSFLPDELERLVAAARRRPLEDARAPRKIRSKLSSPKLSAKGEAKLVRLGEARALLYRFAAGTGLRRGELARLKWADLDFARGIVNVPAASAKSRRDQWTALRSDLSEALKAWCTEDDEAGDLVFPGDVFPTLRTFKLDLLAAGLGKRAEDGEVDTSDDEGRVLDFHSLRVTLATDLARAGVHPRNAQALMRHASIELTMKAYTDVRLVDLRADAERLAPKLPEAEEARRSG